MRGQPGRGGGQARPRAGAMLSHSLWCRAGSPGDWTPQAPLFANLTQTDPLQVEWAGAVGGPPPPCCLPLRAEAAHQRGPLASLPLSSPGFWVEGKAGAGAQAGAEEAGR